MTEVINLKKFLFIFLIIFQTILSNILCFADETNIEYTAAQMSNFQENINITCDNLNQYLGRVFNSNPELEFFYQGYSSSSIGNHHNVTFMYSNKDINSKDIHIVKGEKQLNEILIKAMLYSQENVYIISDTESSIEKLMTAISNDNQIVSMGYKGFSSNSFKSDLTSNTCYKINISYNINPETLVQYKKITEQAAFNIISQNIAKSMPDYIKEKIIHDYIIEHTSYSSEDGELSYIPYNALINGRGVCSAYAMSAKIMFDLVGIENIYVIGTATSNNNTENHGWNIVNIDGNYYHLDLTWDDPVTLFGFDNVDYTYFNVTDDVMSEDHIWKKSDYPKCIGTKYSYDNIKNKNYNDNFTDYYSPSDFESLFDKYKPLQDDYVEITTEFTTISSDYSDSIYNNYKIVFAVIIFIVIFIIILK